MKNPSPDPLAYTRAFSCMECFKCVEDCCPEDLNPLLINEIIKWEYRRNNFNGLSDSIPVENTLATRVLASIQTNPDELEKICSSSQKSTAKMIFFPGCNVYCQPDKLLSSLDILDMLGEDYAFIPGLDFCCGDRFIFSGNIEKADKASNKLISKILSYSPETVVFWCPTCHCRFEKTISNVFHLPFKTISLPRFLADNINRLPMKDSIHATGTIHQACKSVYSGLDLTGVHDLLSQIPCVSFKQMSHSDQDTLCCGSGAVNYFKQSFALIRDNRLTQAKLTGADLLIDECHFCHETFCRQHARFPFTVVNYISLVARAFGIERDDSLAEFIKLDDPEKIMQHASQYIETSPFSKMVIKEVLQQMLGNVDTTSQPL